MLNNKKNENKNNNFGYRSNNNNEQKFEEISLNSNIRRKESITGHNECGDNFMSRCG